MKSSRKHHREVVIGLKTSKIVIAQVQLNGPFEKGKHESVFGGRQTFVWQSLDEVNLRIDKAMDILKGLVELEPKPNLVVFPEYSLPLDNTNLIERLQKFANENDIIIIPGADNFIGVRKILNKCPVIIPNRSEPVWIKKQSLSQWEEGLVDVDEKGVNPILTWEVEGKKYWISIHICVDFLNQTLPEPQDQEAIPGIYIVPMASPEILYFKTIGDVLLRPKSGRAVILCNSVGKRTEGQSCLMATIPGGSSYKPAISLSSDNEEVVVFELYCDNLSLRKKTSVYEKNSALGERNFYEVERINQQYTLFPQKKIEDDKIIEVAVINPAIYEISGHVMRLAFLEVDKYSDINELTKGCHFETLATLGQHDLIVTHLGQNEYDLLRAIEDLPTYAKKNEFDASFFTVEKFHKVLGKTIDFSDRRIFDNPERIQPTALEKEQILKLGQDWTIESILQNVRDKFISERWILGTTTRQPGEINALMTIGLDHGGEIREPLLRFEQSVLSFIKQNPSITSIFEGTGSRIRVHFILRITSSIQNLFATIEEIHNLSRDAKVTISTKTYLILRSFSKLDLAKSLLQPNLDSSKRWILTHLIEPLLTVSDKGHLQTLSETEQIALINYFSDCKESLDRVKTKLNGEENDIIRRLTRGLLYSNFSFLKGPHDYLQNLVESKLSALISQMTSEIDLNKWKKDLNISSGKKSENFTYTERINFVSKAINDGALKQKVSLHNLQNTTNVRNYFSHAKWLMKEDENSNKPNESDENSNKPNEPLDEKSEKGNTITIEDFTNAMKTYSYFLADNL